MVAAASFRRRFAAREVVSSGVIAQLAEDQSGVIDVVATNRDAVTEVLVSVSLDKPLINQFPNKNPEARLVTVIKKILLNRQRDSPAGPNELGREAERFGGDIPEAQRYNNREPIETLSGQWICLGQVGDVVRIVNSRSVAICGGPGLLDQVQPLDRADPRFFQLRSDNAVTRP